MYLSVENLFFGNLFFGNLVLVLQGIRKLCPRPLGGPQGGTQGSKRMLS
jgi:hypothetical protein